MISACSDRSGCTKKGILKESGWVLSVIVSEVVLSGVKEAMKKLKLCSSTEFSKIHAILTAAFSHALFFICVDHVIQIWSELEDTT